jgi:hypothetical protein
MELHACDCIAACPEAIANCQVMWQNYSKQVWSVSICAFKRRDNLAEMTFSEGMHEKLLYMQILSFFVVHDTMYFRLRCCILEVYIIIKCVYIFSNFLNFKL